MKYRQMLVAAALMTSGCATTRSAAPTEVTVAPVMAVSDVADAYIKLTLEAGTHEAEYVDAYYGPATLQEAAKAKPRSLSELIAAARSLTAAVDVAALSGARLTIAKMYLDGEMTRAQALELTQNICCSRPHVLNSRWSSPIIIVAM